MTLGEREAADVQRFLGAQTARGLYDAATEQQHAADIRAGYDEPLQQERPHQLAAVAMNGAIAHARCVCGYRTLGFSNPDKAISTLENIHIRRAMQALKRKSR